MAERIILFDPIHGVGLSIAAGSGRSWMEEPRGDPRHAHLHLDVPSGTLIPVPVAPGPRLHSGTIFVAWDDLLRFAAALEDLADQTSVEVTLAGRGEHETLIVRRRDGDELQAEASFAVGHHVDLNIRCTTRWLSADAATTADQVRLAVRATRPSP
jgi:hypothetical protein